MIRYCNSFFSLFALLLLWQQSYGQITTTSAITFTSFVPNTPADLNLMQMVNLNQIFGASSELSGGIIGQINPGGNITLKVFAYDGRQLEKKGPLIFGCYAESSDSRSSFSTDYVAKSWTENQVSQVSQVAPGSFTIKTFRNDHPSTDIKKAISYAAFYNVCTKEIKANWSWWIPLIGQFTGYDEVEVCRAQRNGRNDQPVIIEATIENATLYKFKVPGIDEFDAKDFFGLQKILQKYLDPQGNPNYVVIAAHRGYWKDYAENSLAAFQAAIDQGVDMVEVDIKKTNDGHLILAHDFQLGRLTNIPTHLQSPAYQDPEFGDYVLSKMNLCDIRPDLCNDYNKTPVSLLRFPDETSQGNGTITERLSTFEEFLDSCKGKILVSLDKIDKDPYMMRKAYEIVRDKGMLNQTIFQGGGSKPLSYYKNAYQADAIPKILFTPAFFDDNLATPNDFKIKIDSFITAGFRVPNCNINYRNDNDKFLQRVLDGGTKNLVEYLSGQNIRVAQFPQWAETSRGNYNPGYRLLNDLQPDIDRRTDWDWMLSKGADMLITDRLEVLVKLLEAKGLRQ